MRSMALRMVAGASIVLVTSCSQQTAPAEEVNPSAALTITMPACGSLLTTVDGTAVYSNGANTGTGTACDGSDADGLRFECPQLIMRDFNTRFGFRWRGDAKQLLANAPPDKTDVYMNGDESHSPVPHDAIVWTDHKYGHTCSAAVVGADYIDCLEQNVKGNGLTRLSYAGGVIGGHPGWSTWAKPAGWVHAKANTSAPATTPPAADGGSTPPPGQPPDLGGLPPATPDLGVPPQPTSAPDLGMSPPPMGPPDLGVLPPATEQQLGLSALPQCTGPDRSYRLVKTATSATIWALNRGCRHWIHEVATYQALVRAQGGQGWLPISDADLLAYPLARSVDGTDDRALVRRPGTSNVAGRMPDGHLVGYVDPPSFFYCTGAPSWDPIFDELPQELWDTWGLDESRHISTTSCNP